MSCTEKIRQHCPPLFEFPAQPIAWSQLHFVFLHQATNMSDRTYFYVCYDAQICGNSSSNIYFTKLSEPSRNLSCQFEYLLKSNKAWEDIVKVFRKIMNQNCSSVANGMTDNCPDKTHFQCGNKCLSKHRLNDYFKDCFDGIDEQYNDSCALNHKYRQKCNVTTQQMNVIQCRPIIIIPGGLPVRCETLTKLPHFPTLCDGYVEHTEKVGETIETDETNCEKWECNNQYTRCDGIWNCRNGADEAWCLHPICNKTDVYPCLLPNTTELICLPVSNANDGKIDCIGATDERYLCKESSFEAFGYQCSSNYTTNEHIMNR